MKQNIIALARQTAEYREAAVRARSERGYSTTFLQSPRKGEFGCDALKQIASRLGEEEGPQLLDDRQTSALDRRIASVSPEKYPIEARWLRSQRRRFGSPSVSKSSRRKAKPPQV